MKKLLLILALLMPLASFATQTTEEAALNNAAGVTDPSGKVVTLFGCNDWWC